MRIRSVKPEFWTSESNGRLSRDARLLFLALLSAADDEGRFGASSRGLASALFPFDEDAPRLLDGWWAELEREGKVRRWVSDGNTYGEILNWSKHQKIDRPSRSRLPRFDESSRVLANPREPSCTDQGSGIRDQGETDLSSKLDRAPPQLELAPAEPEPPGRAETRRKVFAYWQKAMGKTKAKLDEKRGRAIDKAIARGHSLEELCRAIDGCAASPWHRGQNDRGRPYDDLELILRDAAHVERFAAEAPGSPESETPRRPTLAELVASGQAVL